jgi:hypothetical protein
VDAARVTGAGQMMYASQGLFVRLCEQQLEGRQPFAICH